MSWKGTATPPTSDQVLAWYDYSADTGLFTWKIRRGKGGKGKKAGALTQAGYRLIRVGSGRYKAHRLAWLVVYGAWPEDTINHKNGIKDDNRIDNLEVVSRSENTKHAHRTGLTRNAGEGNGRAKLTVEDVTTILSSSSSAPLLADRYGVTSLTIDNIRAGRSWACVPREKPTGART
jgi:hypothetical protein